MILKYIKHLEPRSRKQRSFDRTRSQERGEQLKTCFPVEEGWGRVRTLMPVCTFQYSSWNSVFFSPAHEENWLICVIGCFTLCYNSPRTNKKPLVCLNCMWTSMKGTYIAFKSMLTSIYTRNLSFHALLNLYQKPEFPYFITCKIQFSSCWPIQ